MCGKDLEFSKGIKCSKCNFKIGEARFNEIVMGMNQRMVEQRNERQGFDRFDDFDNKEQGEDEESPW